ncbi:MAG: hypothetical protein ISF22_08385 [Methanomassiliicoccus sp.]|nr:hypothetical protein [Methanomassiliicoccus sp.]
MELDSLEVECPVCDHKVRASDPRCPYCGAEFAMSGVDELESMVRDMNGPPRAEPAPEPVAVVAPAVAVPEEPVGEAMSEDKGGKGLFGKLFRKKR